MPWHDVAGSAGTAMILGSYLALQLGRMSGTGLAYPVLNGMGAVLVLVSLSVDFNLYAVIIEAFWLAISLVGILRWSREARGVRHH